MNLDDFLERAAKEQEKRIRLLEAMNKKLANSLALILQVHPTRNDHEAYVSAVRELAAIGLEEAEQ